MFRFELMVISVVTIVFITSAVKRYFVYKTQTQAGNSAAQTLFERNTQLKKKIDAIEHRLEVLETIVTDRNFQLDEKIRSMS